MVKDRTKTTFKNLRQSSLL